MKKLITILMIVASAMTLVNCTSKKTTTSAPDPEKKVEEIHAKYSDTDIAEGKQLFYTSCKKCHPIKLPEVYSIRAWERILPVMNKRSNLNEEQSAKVRAYVFTNAKKS